jgi:hypothetical protein
VTGVSRGGNHIVPYQPSGLWPYPSERETQKTIAPSAIAKREATTEISEMIKDNNQNKGLVDIASLHLLVSFSFFYQVTGKTDFLLGQS